MSIDHYNCELIFFLIDLRWSNLKKKKTVFILLRLLEINI